MSSSVAFGKSGFEGELLETAPLPHVFTPFFSKFRKQNDSIDGYLDFFRRIPPQVTSALSLYPVYHDVPQHHATIPSPYRLPLTRMSSHPTSTSLAYIP